MPNIQLVLTQKFYLAESTQSAGIATDAWLQTVVGHLTAIVLTGANQTLRKKSETKSEALKLEIRNHKT